MGGGNPTAAAVPQSYPLRVSVAPAHRAAGFSAPLFHPSIYPLGAIPGHCGPPSDPCVMSLLCSSLALCRRADEISSESEVLKSTGSLPVAILELAARPAFLNAEDLSLFFWDSLAIRPGGSYVPGG